MLKTATIIAAVMAATASVAGPARLNDVQYLKAARCEGLISSGGGDASGIKALLKSQRQGRANYIYEKADQMRDDAAREARRAGAGQRVVLTAEVDACQSLQAQSSARTAGGAPTPNTAD